MKIKRLIQRFCEEKFSPSFIFSVLISRTKISLPFKFKFYDDLFLKFYPTSITLGLWRKKYSIESDAKLIENLVKDDFICFDVGANIGHLSLIMAQKAKNGLVFAIEPSRKIFSYFLGNIKINSFTNIVPLNLAISKNEGLEEFYEYLYADDQSAMQKSYNWEANRYLVPTIRLESLMQIFKLNRIDFLKIDVEGAELFVLESLGRYLKNVKYIWFECIEKNYLNFGYSSKDIFNFLDKNNFEIKLFDHKNEKFVKIEKLTDLPDNFRGNLLAIQK